jgi:hypothetical protein
MIMVRYNILDRPNSFSGDSKLNMSTTIRPSAVRSLFAANNDLRRYTFVFTSFYIVLSNVELNVAGIGVVHLIRIFLRLKLHFDFRNDHI